MEHPSPGKPQVAYILWRFPYLTETFIADEVWEIQQHGVDVRLFSLLKPKREPVQPVSERLLRQGVEYAPSLASWHLWWAQLYFISQRPSRYFSLLVDLVRQSCRRSFHSCVLKRAKRVYIFLKAVALAYALKHSSVNLLHTHFAYLPGTAAAIIAALLDLPFTVTTHAYEIYRNSDLLCWVSEKATHGVTISEYNKSNILEMCPDLEARSITVIHCGIDLAHFNPVLQPSDDRPFSIVSVGTLIAMKGHQYLIRACEILKSRGLDFHCQIFGGGPAEQGLRRLIEQCGVEDVVTLRGACLRSTILEAYQQSDLFVLASIVQDNGLRDGIPVVLMEAAAMQLPIVSTTVSGIPEIVHQGASGLLVQERDAEALAEAIGTLAADRDLRERYGRDGRRVVQQQFQLRDNVAKLASLFRRIVAES